MSEQHDSSPGPSLNWVTHLSFAQQQKYSSKLTPPLADGACIAGAEVGHVAALVNAAHASTHCPDHKHTSDEVFTALFKALHRASDCAAAEQSQCNEEHSKHIPSMKTQSLPCAFTHDNASTREAHVAFGKNEHKGFSMLVLKAQ